MHFVCTCALFVRMNLLAEHSPFKLRMHQVPSHALSRLRQLLVLNELSCVFLLILSFFLHLILCHFIRAAVSGCIGATAGRELVTIRSKGSISIKECRGSVRGVCQGIPTEASENRNHRHEQAQVQLRQAHVQLAPTFIAEDGYRSALASHRQSLSSLRNV